MTISKEAIDTLCRPIVGIENRTPLEVQDIMSDRIRSFLSTLPIAGEGKVKALEWDCSTEWKPGELVGEWFVFSVAGHYRLWHDDTIDPAIWHVSYPTGSEQPYEGTEHANLEDAKAAAQSDYETRILSALISSPGKDGGQEVEAAILDVIAERKRQIAIGYDAAHDDKHRGGEIIQAEWGVMRRIDDAIDAGRGGDSQAYMRFLTQAAAQLVAEVGRVKRALAKEAAR